MASPTENYVGTARVSSMDAGLATALIFGDKWGSSSAGSGTRLTWSVPQGTAYFADGYSYYNEPAAWSAFSSSEAAGAARAIKAWTDVSGLTASRVSDNDAVVGEIRFFKTSQVVAGSDGHAYMPADVPRAGDIWMDTHDWNSSGSDADRPGTFAYFALLHEVGHALGLKHPFEASMHNGRTLQAQYDNHFYTVMSYSTAPWAPGATPDFYPTTPMYLDLAAIQHLYGRDNKKNAGNTKYTFYSGQKYWQAIDDAGGMDTIAYAGSEDSKIDLRPGYFSEVTDPISFSDGSTSRTTVTIGPDVIIERAVGGSGSDVLIGNKVANVLKGEVGLDSLSGESGNDQLLGGTGDDILRGGKGKDVFIFDTALPDQDGSNVDRIADFSVRDDTIRLENAIFTGLRKGTLPAAGFCIGPRAKDAKDRIVYDKAAGALFYDPDGTGQAEQVKFATLATRLKLTHKDFDIV